MKHTTTLLCALLGALSAITLFCLPAWAGVPVSSQLPNTPGQVYRVTLAITDPDNPDWIVSQFACGVVCTVTKPPARSLSRPEAVRSRPT